LGDGLKLQVVAADNIAPGQEVFVCLRPHSVRLTPSAEEAEAGRAKGMNLFDGVVQRRVYFGDANDYIVELPAQRLNLRVVAPPTQRYEAGQKIFALADPQQCVLVGEE
jgi:ABC-type Fe3+/spermidine/putrescine transport system ATPase subunit